MKWFVASIHYLALAIGFTGIFIRSLEFRALIKDQNRSLNTLFLADNLWGIAALLWLMTGSLRAFTNIEKGMEFYLASHYFWLKMTLFGAVFLLEIKPMVTLIKWRIRKKSSVENADLANLHQFKKINDLETLLVLLIPFVATAMANGGLGF